MIGDRSEMSVIANRIGPRRWAIALPVVLMVMAATGCGGGDPDPTRTPTSLPPGAAASPTSGTIPLPMCARGRLTIGDLLVMDDRLADALADARQRATAWQADARLIAFQVECGILASELRWAVTFSSVTAQAFFHADTGETEAAEMDVAQLSELPTESATLSFAGLHRSLMRVGAGYTDATELSPVDGVEVRLNSATAPFGPPQAPRGVIYYHVGVIENGVTRDLFVSAETGTIYRYQA